MSSFDDTIRDAEAETLLVLLHGSADGVLRARARGEERLRTGMMPTQGRSTGRRTGQVARAHKISAAS